MNLHEYQAKQIFDLYGLPIPKGYVCNTLHEVEESALKLGTQGPWIMKCQVHAGGRSKSGGVKIVKSQEEIRAFTKQWLGKNLVTYQTNSRGQPVNQILVETVTNISKELYLGGIIDRSTNRIIFMASEQGGIEIEKGVEDTSFMMYKVALDPLIGPQLYQGRELAFALGLSGHQVDQFTTLFMGLSKLFLELDLMLVEINPLVITNDGNLICLDGKVSTDGNALFRQSKLRAMRDNNQEDWREIYAMKLGFNYIALDGNIGCMVNGAGLAMGTMDLIKLYGGEPANFLDVGGSTTEERVTDAFQLILSDKKVKAILVNIFGGIVRCDLISDGISKAISKIDVNLPIIVRLEGNNADLGLKHLSDSGLNIISALTLSDAAQQVVAVAKDE
ncbi:ADP-forming succinate--CoA ligase subunit beta [Candidatus Curculioniphilus buchneri]|uniref:ADP-forming succinate--CoA ligase subunit beta n=1 Tax=Candidatus Curculioniphilus buchneri TaxID=690594 RepID=UPI00376EE0B8